MNLVGHKKSPWVLVQTDVDSQQQQQQPQQQ